MLALLLPLPILCCVSFDTSDVPTLFAGLHAHTLWTRVMLRDNGIIVEVCQCGPFTANVS